MTWTQTVSNLPGDSGPKRGERPTDCHNRNGRNLRNYASPSCTSSKMSARNYHVTHHILVDTVTVTAPRTTISLNNPLRGGCSTQHLQISNSLITVASLKWGRIHTQAKQWPLKNTCLLLKQKGLQNCTTDITEDFMKCSLQHLAQIPTWTCNGDVPFSQLLGCPVLLLGCEEVTDTPVVCNMGCTTDSLGSVWVANPTLCWTTTSGGEKVVPHCTEMDDLVVTVLVVVVVIATLLDGAGFCCKLAGVSGMIWLPTWCWYRTGIWVVWCGTCINQIKCLCFKVKKFSQPTQLAYIC